MTSLNKFKLRHYQNLGEVVESLYRATDSEKVLRLIRSLTAEERAEAWKKVDERIAADKAMFCNV